MFISFFKNNNPSAYIFLSILSLVLWTSGSAQPQDAQMQHLMPLYELLIVPLLAFPFIAKTIAFILVLNQSFLINYIVNKNEVLEKPSFLPALMYIVIMSFDNAMLTLNDAMLANSFILLTLYVFTESYRKDLAFSNVFDAGALFSIATLFYAPTIFLLPVLALGLFVFRPFHWREWVICIIGIMVPYIFTLSAYFWKNSLDYFWKDKIFYTIIRHSISYSSTFYTTIGIVCLLFFLSLGNLINNLTGASQKKIKTTQMLVWIAILGFVSLRIAPSTSCKYFSVIIIPVSVFSAEYLSSVKKKWWGEFLFSILFISVIINLISTHF